MQNKVLDLTHDDLSLVGAKWLTRHGYKYVFPNMKAQGFSENPDVLGMRGGFYDPFVIEVKTSRSDFLADKKKPHRKPGLGIGSHYAYLAPKGLLDVAEIPYGWWLLEVSGKNTARISVSKGFQVKNGKKEFLNTDRKEMEYFQNIFTENSDFDTRRKQTIMSWLSVFFDRMFDAEMDFSQLGNGGFVNQRTSYKDIEIATLKNKLDFERKQKNMIQNQLDMLRGDFRKIDLELEECLKRKTT